jgi:hypothetical protein
MGYGIGGVLFFRSFLRFALEYTGVGIGEGRTVLL